MRGIFHAFFHRPRVSHRNIPGSLRAGLESIMICGTNCGRCFAPMDQSWGGLGRSWGGLWRSWAVLGGLEKPKNWHNARAPQTNTQSFFPLGETKKMTQSFLFGVVVLGGLGAVLGRSRAVLQQFWAILVRSWAILGT